MRRKDFLEKIFVETVVWENFTEKVRNLHKELISEAFDVKIVTRVVCYVN